MVYYLIKLIEGFNIEFTMIKKSGETSILIKKGVLAFLVTGVFLLIFFIGCQAQFKYRVPPENLKKKVSINVVQEDFKSILSYLPKNYDKTGNKDYTNYLQNAINENEKILLPNFPILINDKGLNLKNNSEILFQKNSKLLLKSSAKGKYGIINIIGLSNVALYNPSIIGDRSNHRGKGGEWGMGINILGSNNVSILNPNISMCWGDGIYIGTHGHGLINSDILISGGILNNNRRNAISIISGRKVSVKGVLLSNTNGTLPMAGIDIEPNNNLDKLEDIRIENSISYNNGDSGFLIYLGSLLGNETREVVISIDDCTDYFSRKSISIPGLRNDYKSHIQKISGMINIKNFSSHDSEIAFERSSGNYIYTPSINVDGIKVYNKKNRSKAHESETVKWMKRNRMNVNSQ